MALAVPGGAVKAGRYTTVPTDAQKCIAGTGA